MKCDHGFGDHSQDGELARSGLGRDTKWCSCYAQKGLRNAKPGNHLNQSRTLAFIESWSLHENRSMESLSRHLECWFDDFQRKGTVFPIFIETYDETGGVSAFRLSSWLTINTTTRRYCEKKDKHEKSHCQGEEGFTTRVCADCSMPTKIEPEQHQTRTINSISYIYRIAFIWRENKLTVFLELRSRKTVRFSEQIMSADNYPSIFSQPN